MNKYILFLLITLLVLTTSCTPKHSVYIGLLDYRPAAEIYGVNITETNAVSFDYEPIGSLIVIEQSGKVEIKEVKDSPKNSNDNIGKARLFKQDDFDDLYDKSIEATNYANATSESIIKHMAKAAKDAGGNYILNFNVQRDPSDKNGQTLVATGMVVKRK